MDGPAGRRLAVWRRFCQHRQEPSHPNDPRGRRDGRRRVPGCARQTWTGLTAVL